MRHLGRGLVGTAPALLLLAGLSALPGSVVAEDVVAPAATQDAAAPAATPDAAAAGTTQELGVEPEFSIWDVPLGQPLTAIPDSAAAIIACGTNGGPTSIELKSFGDWEQCTPEASGLREIVFTYDDEQDYIARALELEYRALRGGTSVYAHPVVISILVDDKGVSQGIRIVTDDRASDRDRRVAVVLSKNFQVRYGGWNLSCQDIPLQEGEQKVGSEFIHDLCTGTNPDGSGQKVRIEGSYLRKKGQRGLSIDTAKVNTGYYQSETRLEIVNPPYSPSEGP